MALAPLYIQEIWRGAPVWAPAHSGPFVPPIPGLDGVDVYTNENIFDLRERPDHLLIVGGGPIGMEMAQAHLRLGSKVTVIEGAKAMGNDDPEMAAIVLDKLRAEGVEIVEGAMAEKVSGTGKTVTLQILAEGFSDAGVPVFLSDVKGDLSGLAKAGSATHKLDGAFRDRAATIGFDDFAYRAPGDFLGYVRPTRPPGADHGGGNGPASAGAIAGTERGARRHSEHRLPSGGRRRTGIARP